MAKKNLKEIDLINQLKLAGYSGLFQSGDSSLADSIWQDAANKDALLTIAADTQTEDYVRLLASELLFSKDINYPPDSIKARLASVYAMALAYSSEKSPYFFAANQWGFMYYADKENFIDYGMLGSHLMKTGEPAVSFLIPLLDNDDRLLYEGSEEATVGNSLKYRIKDAAAYYIGKLTGNPVQFYANYSARDAEIERLKNKIA